MIPKAITFRWITKPCQTIQDSLILLMIFRWTTNSWPYLYIMNIWRMNIFSNSLIIVMPRYNATKPACHCKDLPSHGHGTWSNPHMPLQLPLKQTDLVVCGLSGKRPLTSGRQGRQACYSHVTYTLISCFLCIQFWNEHLCFCCRPCFCLTFFFAAAFLHTPFFDPPLKSWKNPTVMRASVGHHIEAIQEWKSSTNYWSRSCLMVWQLDAQKAGRRCGGAMEGAIGRLHQLLGKLTHQHFYHTLSLLYLPLYQSIS